MLKKVRSLQKHIIDINDVDVFAHCWDTELQEEINTLHNPKSSVIENKLFLIYPNMFKANHKESKIIIADGFLI